MTDTSRPEEELEEVEADVEAHKPKGPQTPPIIWGNDSKKDEDDDVEAHGNSKPQTPPIIY